MSNATVKYEALREQLKRQVVRAPFAGVIVTTPGLLTEKAASESVRVGSRLGQGQALFGLASIERLKIIAKVSELDINQLHEGQPVEVTGYGFESMTLKGHIASLGSEALPGQEQGGSSQFELVVSITHLEQAQMQRVRLGMSARLTVTTYRNEQALIVPPEAVRRNAGQLAVDFRAEEGEAVSTIEVQAGYSTPSGLEVFGLKPGFVRVPARESLSDSEM